LVYFMAVLVEFVIIWYIFPSLVCLDREKSGSPAAHRRKQRLKVPPQQA
jgi:hypothetical protein